MYSDSVMRIYKGKLDRKYMSRNARIAYESFNSQKQKCRNPKNRWFKNYGAKGIDVHYGPREFIGWWLDNLKCFNGKRATVSRINHDMGYFFENIRMEDSSDNSREAVIRNKLNLPQNQINSRPIVIVKNGKIIAKYKSIRQAAKALNVSQRLIQFNVRGQYKSIKKLGVTVEYKTSNNRSLPNCKERG